MSSTRWAWRWRGGASKGSLAAAAKVQAAKSALDEDEQLRVPRCSWAHPQIGGHRRWIGGWLVSSTSTTVSISSAGGSDGRAETDEEGGNFAGGVSSNIPRLKNGAG